MKAEQSVAMILVVEDDRACREVTARFLTLRGYQVAMAKDGMEGVSQVLALKPHLVLMDVGLPRLNGWDATAQIRAHPEVANTPIIALTAFVTNEERERCFAAGCDDVIAKPVIFTYLLTRIEQLLKSTHA